MSSTTDELPAYASPRLVVELEKIGLKFYNDLENACKYVETIEKKVNELAKRKVGEFWGNQVEIKKNEIGIGRIVEETRKLRERLEQLGERTEKAENVEDTNNRLYEMDIQEMNEITESLAPFNEALKQLQKQISELEYEPEKENLLEMISFAETWVKRLSYPVIKVFLYGIYEKCLEEMRAEKEAKGRATGLDIRYSFTECAVPLWKEYADKVYTEMVEMVDSGKNANFLEYISNRFEELYKETLQKSGYIIVEEGKKLSEEERTRLERFKGRHKSG